MSERMVKEDEATNVALAAFVSGALLGALFGVLMGVALGGRDIDMSGVGDGIGNGIAQAACIEAGRKWSIFPAYCEPPQ